MTLRSTKPSGIEKLADVLRDTLRSDIIDSKTSNIAGDVTIASVVAQTIYHIGRQLIAPPGTEPNVSLVIAEGAEYPDDLK